MTVRTSLGVVDQAGDTLAVGPLWATACASPPLILSSPYFLEIFVFLAGSTCHPHIAPKFLYFQLGFIVEFGG